MNELISLILNKKNEQVLLTGTVTALTPNLTVELVPDDTSIIVIPITSLIDIKIGSRLLLARFGKQFIAIAVINSVTTKLEEISRVVIKSADENVTSSTDLQDDNHFVNMALESGFMWEIDANLYVIGSTGDFKDLWVLGGSASFDAGGIYGAMHNKGQGVSTASYFDGGYLYSAGLDLHTYPSTVYAFGTVSGTSWGTSINQKFLVTTSGGAGTVKLQWAQNTSNGTATTLKKGSYVKITKLFEL